MVKSVGILLIGALTFASVPQAAFAAPQHRRLSLPVTSWNPAGATGQLCGRHRGRNRSSCSAAAACSFAAPSMASTPE